MRVLNALYKISKEKVCSELRFSSANCIKSVEGGQEFESVVKEQKTSRSLG
jgi:hypothetical protein